MTKSQQSAIQEWSEIVNAARSADPYSLAQAQARVILALKNLGVWPKFNIFPEALITLAERVAIPNYRNILKQNEIRNKAIHPDKDPDFHLTTQIALEAVDVFMNFELWLLSLTLSSDAQSPDAGMPASDWQQSFQKTNAMHAVSLPPPAHISYHPNFFVRREPEEKRALSCLQYPGMPVIVHAPIAFGKSAFVSNMIAIMNREKLYSINRLNGENLTKEIHDRFAPEANQKRSLDGSLSKFMMTNDAIVVLIIENINLTDKTQKEIDTLLELMELGKIDKEPWLRLRLLCTTTSTRQELKNRKLISGTENYVSLEEFTRTQFNQLAAV